MNTQSSLTGSAPVIRRLSDTLWFNGLWFQALWFCTVWGQGDFMPLALVLLALHVWLAHDSLAELQQMLIVGGLGIAVDTLLSTTGVYVFADGALIPLWLCALWLGFAGVLGRSLAWLAVRPAVCSLAAAIAFPLNYWAGQRLGAVEFAYSLPLTLIIVGLVWACTLPMMFWLTAAVERASPRGGL